MGSEPVRARSERRADGRVRRVVARYSGCLGELPARQRRVLRLRAGVGPREPATRAAVARRLELPLVRVRRAERRGLRHLRRAARDGCGAAASDGAGAGVEPELTAVTAGDAPATAGALLASGSAGSSGNGAEADGNRAEGGADRDGGGTGSEPAGGVKGVTAVSGPPDTGETGVVLPILGILLVLTCIAGFGAETRRVWRSRTDVEA